MRLLNIGVGCISNNKMIFFNKLKGGGSETTVRQALQLLREDEQLSELESLLAFFATFVLKTEIVQQIMRWDMAV